MRCIAARQSNVCYFLYEIADNDMRLHIRMNYIPQPQEEKLGYYFSLGHVLGYSKPMFYYVFLGIFFCKWPVINVTLLKFENSST